MWVVTRRPCGSPAASHSRLVSAIACGRDIAHRDIAGFGDQLAGQLAAHARAAAGDDRDPTGEVSHLSCPSGCVLWSKSYWLGYLDERRASADQDDLDADIDPRPGSVGGDYSASELVAKSEAGAIAER